MTEKEAISNLLKLHRTNPLKSQTDFAPEINICRKQLSSLELQKANPSLSTLKKIADYVGLTIPELLWVRQDKSCPPDDGALLAAAMARRVKTFRKQAKISQESFAELIGISVSQLSRIERGLVVPCLNTLQEFARHMGITVSELFLPLPEESDV